MLVETEWTSNKKSRAQFLLCTLPPSFLFFTFGAMGEVFILEKAVSTVRLVDEVRIQPEMQSKEDKSTCSTSNQDFECR